jgi:hypothetical protein
LELKPQKGVRVRVDAKREVIFGDESVDVLRVSIPEAGRQGILTGLSLAGYCEVEMPSLDGKKHWYPIGDLVGESGEKIVEEEIPADVEEND